MLSAPPRSDSILARRLCGMAASALSHAAVIALASWQGSQAVPAVLQASAASAASARAATPTVVAVASVSSGGTPTSPTRRPTLELAGIEVDLDRLTGTPAELFPFVLFESVDGGAARATDGVERRLTNPLVSIRSSSRYPPLRLDAVRLQALVDRAWSRRERWRPFLPIADLVDQHDGDTGQVADLLRAYADQNLLQPYYDGDTLDARYWTMLGLAADHVRFVDRVTRYLREQPGTKAATELLFLLDELVQGSLDTLLMVASSDPAADLRRTASEQLVAYARAEALHAETRGWLRGLGLDTPDAIRRRLEAVRLGLLRTIVERSPAGYRVSDAHYLAGVIYFQRRERDAALAAWSRAVPGPDDLYRAALADIRSALALPPERRVAGIVAALGAEHGRWLAFSEQRLRQFGYQAERF